MANTDHTWHKALEYFSDILFERSNGKIIVKVFPNEQLGKEIELIRSIKTGIADMTITGGSLQNWTDIVGFSDMPFIFRDSVHMKKLVDGPIGKEMEKRILEETGIRIVTYFIRGPRYLTSNRPITGPDDLNGLIVRVPNVPSIRLHGAHWVRIPHPWPYPKCLPHCSKARLRHRRTPWQ